MTDPHDRSLHIAPPGDGILPRLQPEEAGYALDEIAGLRHMMQRGDVLVVAGGASMAWWGLCLAANFAWAALAARQGATVLALWSLAFVGAGYLGNFAMDFLRGTRTPVLSSWRTEAISTVWLFAGAGVILITLGHDLTGHGDENGYAAACCVLFAVVLAVMASSGRRPKLFWAAGGWMLAGAAMFVLPDVVLVRAVLSAAFLLGMALPGTLLALSEKDAAG